MLGNQYTPVQSVFNQLVVIAAAALGSLYIYRSIEQRIVALESRVKTVENILGSQVKS